MVNEKFGVTVWIWRMCFQWNHLLQTANEKYHLILVAIDVYLNNHGHLITPTF